MPFHGGPSVVHVSPVPWPEVPLLCTPEYRSMHTMYHVLPSIVLYTLLQCDLVRFDMIPRRPPRLRITSSATYHERWTDSVQHSAWNWMEALYRSLLRAHLYLYPAPSWLPPPISEYTLGNNHNHCALKRFIHQNSIIIVQIH